MEYEIEKCDVCLRIFDLMLDESCPVCQKDKALAKLKAAVLRMDDDSRDTRAKRKSSDIFD